MAANYPIPVEFFKYHGLGNDYLVVEQAALNGALPGISLPAFARWICDRHYGVGGDGLLVGQPEAVNADFGLRIFNPDGSEAEKSGNGIRIFAKYLWEKGRAALDRFTVQVPGGIVECQVLLSERTIRVKLGQAHFINDDEQGGKANTGAVIESIQVANQHFQVSILSLGNPHCVVLDSPVSEENARRLGPLIEYHNRFPQRTNVQFLQLIDRQSLRIEIWERGAGYTRSSGSSACAAASVAHRLGWCDPDVQVIMPGGKMFISMTPAGDIFLKAPVEKICQGQCWYDPSVLDKTR